MQEPYIREGFGTSAYHGLTLIHPIGLAAVVVAAVWLLLSHKSQAWLPVLLVACFVPTSQRVVVATLDFNLIRILLAVATFRILQRQEYRGLRFTHLDQAFLAWVLLSALIHVLRLGTVPGMISKLGSSYDALGLYAVARCWFRNIQDLMRLSRAAAIIACISVVGFAVERTTGKNMYAVFGGVPEITTVREGRLRCQGPFAHAILAGTFWVAFLPLVFARALSARGRKTLVAGVVSIIVIVVLCSSSTPLLGVIASAGFGVLWFARKKTSVMRWGTLGMLLVMHLIMNAPVWHLIARVGVVGGSTGYHRYRLIDAFIYRWPEWFLLGTNSTAHWGWYLFDVTNQFVKEGVRGGIIGLLAFVLVLQQAFSGTGKRIRAARRRSHALLMWAVGSAIAAHCIMFIGISIDHSNTNMLAFLWLLAASQARPDNVVLERQSVKSTENSKPQATT